MTSKSIQSFYLDKLDDKSLTAFEIYTALIEALTPHPILKVSFSDSFKPQQQVQSLRPEVGFNVIDSHPFLSTFIFKDAVTLRKKKQGEEKKDDGRRGEEADGLALDKESGILEDFMKFIVGVNKGVNEISIGLWGKGKRKVEEGKLNANCEAWMEDREFLELKNEKVRINRTSTGVIRARKEKEDAIERKKIKIASLHKKFRNERIKVVEFEFGFLSSPDKYNSFFSSKKVDSFLDSKGCKQMDIEFGFDAEEQGSSHKIFLIIRLLEKIEWKIEFSFKFCHTMRIEMKKDKIHVYASLIVQPKMFLYEIQASEYESPFLRDGWERVPNFILLKQEFETFLQLFLLNNTTIHIVVPNNREAQESLLKFEKKAQKTRLLSHLDTDITSIPFRTPSSSSYLSSSFISSLSFGSIHENFAIHYNFLCLVSENRINIFDNILKSFIKKLGDKPKEKIENDKKENLNKLHPKDLEKTLEKCSKILPRCYFGDLKENEEDEETEDNHFVIRNFRGLSLLSMKERSIQEEMEEEEDDNQLLATRKVTITPSGPLFGLKEIEFSNRVLRKYANNLDGFLRIRFADDNMQDSRNMKHVVNHFFRYSVKPFHLFDREFRFLAYSASQLRSSSCWLFSTIPNSQLTIDKILKDMGNFEEEKIPAKRAARMGQSFAASVPFDLGSKVVIREEEDVKARNGGEFSDGIGKIGKEIMTRIKRKKKLSEEPAAIQIRFKGSKGVLALDPDMNGNSIILRRSMIKFQGNNDNMEIEILDYNKFRGGYLNRQIILLLITLGVKDKVFLDLQHEYLEDLKNCELKDASIFKYFNADFNGEIVQLEPIPALIRRLFNSGFELTKDPFFIGIQQTLRQRGLINLKTKSNILVKKAARLLGVLDEYGVLGENEVFVQVQGEIPIGDQNENQGKREIIEGKVVVTRNPCLHPGDIKVLNAVSHPKLKHFVNCVVFPRKGERPVTNQISGGDLDGDLYFVGWDERLLPPSVFPPMDYTPVKQNKPLPPIVTQEDILSFFFDYMNFDILGNVANSHLALSDQRKLLAKDEDCIRLAEIHSDAVDFVKSGVPPTVDSRLKAKSWPDFMREKKHLLVYESQTVLGQLYREIKDIIKGEKNLEKENIKNWEIDEDLIVEGWQKYRKEAAIIVRDFHSEMDGLLSQFGIRNEFEVYSGNFSKLSKEERKGKANIEILQRRILNSVIALKDTFTKRFRSELNGANHEAQLASAIYLTSYLNETHNDSKSTYSYPEFTEIYNSKIFMTMEELFKEEKNRFIGLPWLICSDELIKLKIKKRKERSKSGKEMGSIMETRKGEMENVENSVDEEFLSSGEEK